MKSGLLWYDADPQTGVSEKVARAAERYRQKLGRYPTVCYMHPAESNEPDAEVACRPYGADGGSAIRIRLATAAQILPHHFWLGEEDGPESGGTAAPMDCSPGAARAGSQPVPAAARPPRKAAQGRREEGRLLLEAMAARGGRRRQAVQKAQS